MPALTVWRHGEAGNAIRDELRPLTQRGVTTVSAAAIDYEAWRSGQQISGVSAVWHSPLVRTSQTAALLGAALGIEPKPSACLAPGTSLAEVEALVDGEEHALIVSHQPFVSMAIDHWLGDGRVAPLLPGGWACLTGPVFSAGLAMLENARTDIFS